MITYSYTAKSNKTGKMITAEVQADSKQAVASLLLRQNMTPIDINEKGDNHGLFGLFKNRIRNKDVILFTRQLSTLISAGLPLAQSLSTVQKQIKNKAMADIIGKVISDVEGGSSLTDAFAKHPKAFNSVFVSLIAAGEASGTLDKVLERIANQKEKEAEIISKVRGAMVYPIIVLAVMIGVVIFMVVGVLPTVEQIYSGVGGAELPLVTKFLLAISNFIRNFWWFIIILLFAAIFLMSRWAQTLGGRRTIDELKIKVWPIKNLFLKMYMGRFSQVGATLIGSGVPLIQTLYICAKSVNNVLIKESIETAAEKVKGGKALSDSLKNDPYFLPLVPDMLRIGERSGSMEKMLAKTAEYYEKEVDNEIKAISTTIEPALMIMMGLVAIVIVTAILLPIYSLVGKDLV